MSGRLAFTTLVIVTTACGGAAESAVPAERSTVARASSGGSEEWSGTFGGLAAGSYSGPIAIAKLQDDRVTHVQLYSDPAGSTHVTASLMASGTPVAAGGPGPVEVEVIFADSPDLYDAMQRGTASSLQSGRDGDPRFPPVPSLAIASVSATQVIGTLTGELYQARPAPGDPSKRAPIDLTFTARACHAGTPDFTACTNPRSPWPPEASR